LLKVLVVASAIFKRRNPGAAEDGSGKLFIVARAISKRRSPGAAGDGGVKVLIGDVFQK